MKKLEELLNTEFGKKFDTPKRLNRSSDLIPLSLVDSLEEGNFTFEMLSELQKQFPIYRYRSCITIHGQWPDIEIGRIGRYKNIIQNNNKSLEVRYSAIDIQKKLEVSTFLKEQLRFRDVHFNRSSESDFYTFCEPINKENYVVLKAKYLAITKRFEILDLYGFLSLNIWPVPGGGNVIRLDVRVLTLATDQVEPLIYALTGMDKQQVTERVLEIKALEVEEEKEREIRKAEYAKQQAELVLKRNAAEEEGHQILQANGFRKIEKIEKEGTVFRAIYDMTLKSVAFSVIKYSRSGQSLKRATIGSLNDNIELASFSKTSHIAVDLKKLLHEGKLFVPGNTPANPKSDKDKAISKDINPVMAVSFRNENTKVVSASTEIVLDKHNVKIVPYKERVVAIVGNTYGIKDILYKSNALFRKGVLVDGVKQAGWILAADSIDNLLKDLSA